MTQSSETLLALLKSNYTETGNRSMILTQYCSVDGWENAIEELSALGYIKKGKYLDGKITLL